MDDQTVADLMTQPVLTVEGDEPAGEVAGAMAKQAIKSIVVTTEDCAVEGIFTATDYMHLDVDGRDPSTTSIAECMTTGVVTVSPDASVETAANLMASNDISHLPVVDGDDQVTGILTSTDLVPVLAE